MCTPLQAGIAAGHNSGFIHFPPCSRVVHPGEVDPDPDLIPTFENKPGPSPNIEKKKKTEPDSDPILGKHLYPTFGNNP